MSNKFEKVVYKNSHVPNIQRCISDPKKFKFAVKIKGKRHTRIFYAPIDTKPQMVKTAIEACRLFCETTEDDYLWKNKDTGITVKDIWAGICKTKIRQKLWGKTYQANVQGFYKNHIEHVIGSMPVSKIRSSHITVLMNGLSKVGSSEPLSKRSRKRCLEVISQIFAEALEMGLVRENPIKKKHHVKRSANEEVKIILSPEIEFKKTHKVLNELFGSNPRLLSAFLWGFHGKRLSEVLRLKWSDIDFDNLKYKLEKTKNKKDVRADLPREIADVLLKVKRGRKKFIYSSERSDEKHWRSLQHHYKKIRVHLPEYGFHRCRNLMASCMFQDGASINEISEVLNHSSIAMTERYLTMQYTEASRKINERYEKILSGDEHPTE